LKFKTNQTKSNVNQLPAGNKFIGISFCESNGSLLEFAVAIFNLK